MGGDVDVWGGLHALAGTGGEAVQGQCVYKGQGTEHTSYLIPPCPPQHIKLSLVTTTMRSVPYPVAGMSQNISNSPRIHASIRPLLPGGSVPCSYYSSYSCSGCTSRCALLCRGEPGHRSYILTDTQISTSIALPPAQSSLRHSRMAEHGLGGQCQPPDFARLVAFDHFDRP